MPTLVVTENGQERRFEADPGKPVTIGRVSSNTVHLADAKASREHARILFRDGGWWVEDLDSSNGTKVNGEPVQRHRLQAGDEIRIGAALLMMQGIAPATMMAPPKGSPPVARAESTSEPPPAARAAGVLLLVAGPGAPGRFALSAARVTLGRADTNAVVLETKLASNVHAEIVLDSGHACFMIRDLASTNGIKYQGNRVPSLALSDGTEFEIGDCLFRFTDPTARQAAKAEAVAAVAAEKRKFPVGFAVASSVGALLFIFVALPAIVRLFAKPTQPVPPQVAVSGNLLANPSFEEVPGSAGNGIPGWELSASSAGAQVVRDTSRSADGPTSLRIDRGTATGAVSCFAKSEIPLDSGYGLELTGSLRAAQTSGFAALRVEWWGTGSAGTPMASSLPVVVKGGSDWSRLTAYATAPPGARRAVVSCVGGGEFGTASFDGVAAVKRLASKEVRLWQVPLGGDSVAVEPTGRFWVWRSDAPLLSGGVALGDTLRGGGQMPETARPVSGFPIRGEAGLQVKGEVYDAPSGKWIGFEQTWVATPQGVSITCRWPKIPASQASGWMFRAGVPGSLLDSGTILIAEAGTTTKTGPFSRERDVSEIVWRPPGGTLAIAGDLALVVSATAEGEGWTLWAEGEGAAGPSGELTASFTLRPASLREESALRSLSGEITAAEKSGALGEAIAKCRRVVDEFSRTSQAKTAAEKLSRLTSAAETALEDAERALARARESRSESSVAEAVAKLRALEKSYAGSEFGDRARTLAEKGAVPLSSGPAADDEPTALLKMAREALAREEFLTAEVYARNARRLGAGKPVEAEAQKGIDEIRAASVAAKDRDEWIMSRLSTARNFVKQGQSERAVPIFEEVLAKYPSAKLCQGVAKELEEARR